MSMRTYLLPTESFLERMEAMSCDSGSRLRRRSTRINLSSDGARPREQPQARHAFVFFTIFCRTLDEKSNFVIVSITSAVPDAEVIALLLVLGITTPATAHIETTIGVVLFPAIPPMQCLSTMSFVCQCKFTPVLYIASVR